MMALAHDLRLALRSLLRAPIFSGLVVISLAVSIGTATLAYGVYYAVNVRPLAAEAPERLVTILAVQSEKCGVRCLDVFPMGTFAALGAQSSSVVSAAAYKLDERLLGDSSARDRIDVAAVSGSFFPLLGTPAYLGRSIQLSDDSVSAVPTVVLSYGFWTSRFARRRDIVGRSIVLDGVPHTVLGVMPAGFTLPTGAVAWTAATPDSVMRPGRARMVEGIGRLRDGVPIARANAEWQLLAQHLDTPRPTNAPTTRADLPSARVLPLAEARHGIDTTLALALLAIATHFLIMCCNVQGALMLRVLRRRRELAIRSALGGGRRDFLRLAVMEIGLLLLASCVLGSVLISWGLRAAQALLGARFPFLFTVSVDPAVTAAAIGLTLIVCILLLAGYAWAADSLDLRTLLNDSAPTGTRRSGRLRNQLVVLQVALALFLSVLAASLARSFQLASHTDLGVRADGVLTVPLDLSGTPYDSPDQARALVDQISHTLAVGAPGSSVAVWRSTSPSEWGDTTLIEGSELPLESFKCRSSTCLAPWSSEDVTPSFFGTLGVPVVRGRAFSSIDGPGDPPVVVLNEVAAAKWWPGQDPIGKRIRLGGASSASPWLTVVGVVHAPYPLDHMSLRLSLREGNGYPLLFRPLAQTTIDSRAELKSWMWFRKLWVGLAAPNGGGAQMQRMVREEIAAIAPGVQTGPIASLRTTLVDYTGWPTVEANARLASVFGIVGVAIALLGVCGVTAEAVRARSRELATRMALGASPRLIVQHVIARAAVLAGSGVALGMAICVVASGFISRLFLEGDAFVRGERFSTGLRGTSLLDPMILVPLGLALFGTCVLASYLPARIAARIDPATPLRSD